MLHAFREDMTLRTYNQILSHIFEGIAYNRELPVLLDIDVEKRHTGPLFLEADDGTESLAVLTDTEGLERHTFLWVKIRELIRECEDNEKCDGFVFNHNREDLFSLPLTLLQAAIHAGHQVAVDEIRKETERIAEERGAVRPRA